MRRCRSIDRALRRGHPLLPGRDVYTSKKEALVIKKKYEAMLKKASEKEDKTEEQNEQAE